MSVPISFFGETVCWCPYLVFLRTSAGTFQNIPGCSQKKKRKKKKKKELSRILRMPSHYLHLLCH